MKPLPLGHLRWEENRNRYPAANPVYAVGWMQIGNEVFRVALTQDDLKTIADRARVNKEDIPPLKKPGFFQRLLNRFL